MDWLSFRILTREDYVNLLGNIRVKFHLLLVGPISYFLQVSHQVFMGSINIVVYSCKQRCVLCEELDVRRDFF